MTHSPAGVREALDELAAAYAAALRSPHRPGLCGRVADWLGERGWERPDGDGVDLLALRAAFVAVSAAVLPEFPAAGPGEPSPLEGLVPQGARILGGLAAATAGRGSGAAADHDALGTLLEGLLPPSERHRLGQHFTHPDVADLLVAGCVRRPRERVLDAGCGTGLFLLRALDRKRALAGTGPAGPLAGDLCGIERSRLPLRLAAGGLAARGGAAAALLLRDFFTVSPAELAPFDAIVGNPPYTRHEAISADKAAIAERVLGAYPGLRLSRRAPLHVYFLLHAARFLRPGGRIGLVLPSGWLASDYGADLQAWLLRHFARITVVEAESEPWFRIPSVNACLLSAERRAGRDAVRFVRLRAPLARLLPPAGEARWRAAADLWRHFADGRHPGLRAAAVPRERVGRSWSVHLRAPDVYLDLLRRAADRLVPLGELAEIRFAVKTGVNGFFCLRPGDPAAADIEARYLVPLILSLKDAPAIRVAHAPHRLFRCDGPPPEGSRAAAHILRGEAAGYHLRPTCAARRPWYALGRREPWPLLYPERSGERFLVLFNEAGAAVNKNLYELRPRDPRLTLPLCALLNSTWTRLGNELHGRVLVGRQDVVDSDACAVARIPVPDLRRAAPDRLDRLERALRALWERPIRPIESELAAAGRAELDAAALAALTDAPPPIGDLQRATLGLVRSRLRKGEGVGDAAYRPRPREG